MTKLRFLVADFIYWVAGGLNNLAYFIDQEDERELTEDFLKTMKKLRD